MNNLNESASYKKDSYISDNNNSVQDCLNKLVMCEVTNNYTAALDILANLSDISFFITKENIKLIDSCFKNTVNYKRKEYQKLEFIISTVNLEDNYIANGKLNNSIQNLDNKNNFDEYTKDIMKSSLDNDNQLDYKEMYYNNLLNKDKKLEILNLILDDLKLELPKLYEFAQTISIKFLDNLLNNDYSEVKLFFYKSIADFKRYTFEISCKIDDKLIMGDYYSKALKEALLVKEADKFNLSYIKFYLNYTVYLHDIMEETEKAILEAKKVLQDALFVFDDIKNNNEKDIILICQILKDNIAVWSQGNINKVDLNN